MCFLNFQGCSVKGYCTHVLYLAVLLSFTGLLHHSTVPCSADQCMAAVLLFSKRMLYSCAVQGCCSPVPYRAALLLSCTGLLYSCPVQGCCTTALFHAVLLSARLLYSCSLKGCSILVLYRALVLLHCYENSKHIFPKSQ
jgi:hypothetical protein